MKRDSHIWRLHRQMWECNYKLAPQNFYCCGVVGLVGVVVVPPLFVPFVVDPEFEDPKLDDPNAELFVDDPGVLFSPEADPSPPLELAIPPPKMLDFA